MNIVYFLLGYIEVYVKNAYAVSLLNICMYYSIPYSRFEYDDGGISMRFRLSHYKKVKAECVSRGVELCEKKRGGLIYLLYNHRKRSGLFVGGLLVMLMIAAFEGILWDVRVSGNSSITSSQIIEMLDGHGVRVGANKNKIHTQSIENKILIESDDISFISINIQGNIAHVEVRERVKENPPEPKKYANIVAKKSGIVENAQIYRGNLVVRYGQYVDAGDLLISGIYDSKVSGFRFTRANGRVMARTIEEFVIEIPLQFQEKRYTGRVNYEKNLNFFGFSVKISKNYRNNMVLYDTISNVESCSFIDGVEIPIDKVSTCLYEYEYVDCKLSISDATNLAYFKLNEKIRELGDIEILKKKTDTYMSDDKLMLVCTIVCVEDISCVSEFDVDLSIKES